MIFQGDKFFNINFFTWPLACFVHKNSGQYDLGRPSQGDTFFNIQLAKSFENSLILNSFTFYWHGGTFFNIHLFKPPLVCFVHIHGG